MSITDVLIVSRESALERQVLALPLYFCDPIIIGRHPDTVGPDEAAVFTASCTYLELLGRRLLVTNAHVVRKYQQEYAADDRTTFQIPGIGSIDPLTQLIDIDDGSDLATIDLRNQDLSPRAEAPEAFKPRQYHQPADWPPADVVAGDIVAYAGWPGCLRKDLDGLRTIEHNPYSICAVSVSLSMSDRFNIKLDRSDLKYAFGRSEPDEKDYDFGGMSGAPVLRRGSIAYDLVGIISEYQELADTFVVTSVANIKRSGELWHNTRR